MASTRPSHAAWNTGSFFSTSTLPKPSTPPISCTLSIRNPTTCCSRYNGAPIDVRFVAKADIARRPISSSQLFTLAAQSPHSKNQSQSAQKNEDDDSYFTNRG